MENKHNHYCIILAGGAGKRLWPVSSRELPKQFIDFFGLGRTLLQQTYDRFAAFLPADHIYVSTYAHYTDKVHEQLPELPYENILPEPVQLNTAAAAIWATWHVVMRNPEALVVASPSDQLIQYPDRFREQIELGFDYVASHHKFLAMGVRPTSPNTAYGYIQMGATLLDGRVYRVKSFTEKPELEYAKMFEESGEFLWNTGLFMWSGTTMGEFFDLVRGREPHPVDCTARQELTFAEEIDYVRSTFPSEVPRSLDLMILEHAHQVAVQECSFGWIDIGCWGEVHAAANRDADGNAVSGKERVLFSGSEDCVVALPDGMKAVIAGLKDVIVALKGDTLLVCPKNDPDAIRRLINQAQMELE